MEPLYNQARHFGQGGKNFAQGTSQSLSLNKKGDNFFQMSIHMKCVQDPLVKSKKEMWYLWITYFHKLSYCINKMWLLKATNITISTKVLVSFMTNTRGQTTQCLQQYEFHSWQTTQCLLKNHKIWLSRELNNQILCIWTIKLDIKLLIFGWLWLILST